MTGYKINTQRSMGIAHFQGIVKSTDAEGENLGLYLLGKRPDSGIEPASLVSPELAGGFSTTAH